MVGDSRPTFLNIERVAHTLTRLARQTDGGDELNRSGQPTLGQSDTSNFDRRVTPVPLTVGPKGL